MTAVPLTPPAPQEFIGNRRPKSAVSLPTPLAFTICMEMSGNGVRTFGMRITTGPRRMEVPGSLAEIALAGCCVVVLGTSTPGIAAAPFAAGTMRTSGSTTGVFV